MNITIDDDELEKAIITMLKPGHKDAAKAIVGICADNDYHKGIVFKAAMGILPTAKYAIGDEVIVRSYAVGSYLFDKEIMLKKGMLVDNCITATITFIDIYRRYCYRVKYSYIDDGGNKQEGQADIGEDDVSSPAEPVLNFQTRMKKGEVKYVYLDKFERVKRAMNDKLESHNEQIASMVEDIRSIERERKRYNRAIIAGTILLFAILVFAK